MAELCALGVKAGAGAVAGKEEAHGHRRPLLDGVTTHRHQQHARGDREEPQRERQPAQPAEPQRSERQSASEDEPEQLWDS